MFIYYLQHWFYKGLPLRFFFSFCYSHFFYYGPATAGQSRGQSEPCAAADLQNGGAALGFQAQQWHTADSAVQTTQDCGYSDQHCPSTCYLHTGHCEHDKFATTGRSTQRQLRYLHPLPYTPHLQMICKCGYHRRYSMLKRVFYKPYYNLEKISGIRDNNHSSWSRHQKVFFAPLWPCFRKKDMLQPAPGKWLPAEQNPTHSIKMPALH